MMMMHTTHYKAGGVARTVQPINFAKCRANSLRVQASTGVGLFQKLGRVLKEKAAGDFDRFFKGTVKTRERLGLVEELLAFWSLEDYESTMEELEEVLIAADFGPKTALKIVDIVRGRIKSGEVKSAQDVRAALKASIVSLLSARGASASELALSGSPAVVMVVGVNGSGKTTTVGKLAAKFKEEGASVFVVPGDTFRAAAAEQLAEWARRAGARIGPFKAGARPQVAIEESLAEVKSLGDVDIVLIDTAGRLHTAYGLMEELAACRKYVANKMKGQPCEVLLVLDGTTGLNMINQAKEFSSTVPITGLVLTKLDGTARGGAAVSVVDQLKLPIKFIGVGETADDMKAFNPDTFVDALFPTLPSA